MTTGRNIISLFSNTNFSLSNMIKLGRGAEGGEGAALRN
jgi:hypothetical protein